MDVYTLKNQPELDEPKDTPLLGPMRTSTLSDQCYLRLTEAIASLQLRPGTPISETDLAHRFGVSKSPVREALQRLSRDGLVILEPNKRCLVSRLDLPTIRDWYEFRLILEPASLSRVAPKINEYTIDDLRKATRIGQEHFRQRNSLGFIEKTDQFHLTLIESTHNSSLIEVARGLFNKIRRVRIAMYHHQQDAMARNHPVSEGILSGHIAILDRLSEKNYGQAVDLLCQDIQNSIDHVNSGDLSEVIERVTFK